jgi:TolA-binding protein
MKNKKTFLAACLILPVLSSCNLDMKKIESKAALINKYENVALKLAKENRELHAEVKRLEFEIQKLKQENSFYAAQKLGKTDVDAKPAGRSIASVNATPFAVKKDFVEFKTYKWTAEDMMKIADKEFKSKNFEKAAQFYTSLENNYPDFKHLNDEFYFKAGISAFESGEHHDWTIKHFETLMTKYPTSQYFRSAKLWVALTHMKLGEKTKFFATVEEFRKKYRNTNEWKILSSYYEKIEEKTHE